MAAYTCPRELVPIVESALAADGYQVEPELQRVVGAARVTVMTRGSAVVSFHEEAQQLNATIMLHGESTRSAMAILEELPRLMPTPLPRRKH